MLIILGAGITASVAVGILAFSYDPYQAGTLIKLLFFSGLGMVSISLIGLIYFSGKLLFKRFKK